MTEKEFKRREPPFRCDLVIVLESEFKAAKQLSSKAGGVSCQIAKGYWAVKLGWLDRIAKETEDNADGDDGDDDHKLPTSTRSSWRTLRRSSPPGSRG